MNKTNRKLVKQQSSMCVEFTYIRRESYQIFWRGKNPQKKLEKKKKNFNELSNAPTVHNVRERGQNNFWPTNCCLDVNQKPKIFQVKNIFLYLEKVRINSVLSLFTENILCAFYIEYSQNRFYAMTHPFLST